MQFVGGSRGADADVPVAGNHKLTGSQISNVKGPGRRSTIRIDDERVGDRAVLNVEFHIVAANILGRKQQAAVRLDVRIGNAELQRVGVDDVELGNGQVAVVGSTVHAHAAVG